MSDCSYPVREGNKGQEKTEKNDLFDKLSFSFNTQLGVYRSGQLRAFQGLTISSIRAIHSFMGFSPSADHDYHIENFIESP